MNPGFNPHNVLNFGLTFPPSFGVEPPDALREHFRQITADLESVPGVEAASMVDAPLPIQREDSVSFWQEGEPKPPSENDMHWAFDLGVQPNYLKVLQIPLKQGRFITEKDTMHTPAKVVIDEVLARKYFPNENPIGKTPQHLRTGRRSVGNCRSRWTRETSRARPRRRRQQASALLRDYASPDTFVSLWPVSGGTRFVVRTKGDPLTTLRTIRAMFQNTNTQPTLVSAIRISGESIQGLSSCAGARDISGAPSPPAP